ncbi:uncharacterized protein LOC117300600 [Asterias rubens]|uniref:uncharacterized protein LOC117300600 n=1 Tax=Asterias rubens TaxID=7604 RepID=UPI0014552AE6|nr:uncharacterized protein LOC117300600 [Asterias rubens]
MTTHHTVGVQPQQQQVISHPQQGQQQIQGQQQQTVTYQTVQAQPHASGAVISSYSVSGARQTGYIQVVCGVVSVAIGIAAIVLGCSIAAVGSPIWSGICFFIVAGILGIASAGNQNSCAIVAHLVMSILASLAAFQLMIILIIAALTETFYCGSYFYYNDCSSRYGRIIVDSIGCIVALIEFVVAIVAAAICCRGSCGYGTVATQQTVVHHYVPNQGNVTTIMTSPQPYGQQVYMQQPGQPQQVQGYAISPPQPYHMPPPNMAPQQVSSVNQLPAVPPPYQEKPGTTLPEPQA